jgi:predicted nucleotidyltransferase
MTDLASTISLQSAQPARQDAVPNKGPFASEDEALRVVVQRLVDKLDPDEVWLFGSRAEGVHQPDSDFDLLVVTAPEDGDAGFDYDRVYAPIKGLGIGCDVVPCRADAFALDRADPTSLCWRVVQTGRRLYERRASDSGILRSR